ncbi:sulfatase-like hydrolase/transferase [Litoribaculum gwangyangense]|uniref:sulfatase-like hydrolase/transferase n=1 Tax=Litoribaculum gwangyangense TaxID=1130722 RepID=UPI003CD07116
MIKSIPLLLIFSLSTISYPQEKPNVLFIVIDDLNDWVGVLNGHPQTKTPNMDALAKSGMLFSNAHCQAPICAPSRASVMSGLYPTKTGNYLQLQDIDIKKSNTESSQSIFLPDYFEKYGYKTMGLEKFIITGMELKPLTNMVVCLKCLDRNLRNVSNTIQNGLGNPKARKQIGVPILLKTV